MTNLYPYRSNTTPPIAAEDDSRYETPGGAQQKVNAHISLTSNIADRAVTQPKIADGAVGGRQLDPALLQNYGDIAVQGQFQVVNEQLAETETNKADRTELTAVTVDLTEQTKLKNSIPSPLRIAMHYYYENDPGKLTLLKSLGFNCIMIARLSDFLTDTARTLAFLDRLFENGVSTIMYVSHTELEAAGTTPYKTWMNAIKDHPAMIGFSHYDEPFDQNIPIVTTEAAYNTIKAYSDKPIFVVDPGHHVDTYTPDCFDIFIMDIYLTEPANAGLTQEQIKRNIYYRYLRLYKRTLGKRRPKRFIPMFPLFSQVDGGGAPLWNLPTTQLIRHMIDTYSLFNTTDYAAFGFNVKEINPNFTAIEDSDFLQKQCGIIRTMLYNSKQEIVYVNPKSFKMHKNYVSSSNMEYNATHGTIYVPTGNASGEVVYKFQKDSTFTGLYPSVFLINQGGLATHTINISISFDGVTYEQTKTVSLPPTVGITFPAEESTGNVFIFPEDDNFAYVKFELVYTGTPGDDTAIGITEISFTII